MVSYAIADGRSKGGGGDGTITCFIEEVADDRSLQYDGDDEHYG